MSERTATRRTVLKACGAACLGATAVTASAGDATATPASESTAATDQFEASGRSGLYSGVVDRIVDGEHVVVLVDEGRESPEQLVFDHERAPSVEEGDFVRVWLWRGQVLSVWRR